MCVLTRKKHWSLENQLGCLSFAVAQHLSLQLCPNGVLSYEGTPGVAVPSLLAGEQQREIEKAASIERERRKKK